MAKTTDQLRTDYELDVLRTTVFRDARTKADALQAVIKYAYDRVLADRLTSTSTITR
jgi:hypothetical protein